jgi:hypothetical protein
LDAATQTATLAVQRRFGWESERFTVPVKPVKAGGGKGPHFWKALDEAKVKEIGGEPDNS